MYVPTHTAQPYLDADPLVLAGYLRKRSSAVDPGSSPATAPAGYPRSDRSAIVLPYPRVGKRSGDLDDELLEEGSDGGGGEVVLIGSKRAAGVMIPRPRIGKNHVQAGGRLPP